ncbi:MAG: polysaccharide export protein [Pseudomonadota bacterium]|nr:polysaccharide export protein [Pseudomonadota bacterium]
MKLNIAVPIMMVLSLCGCGGGQPVLSSGERYRPTMDMKDAYHLGAGDKVRVTVFNEPQLSGEYVVGADGALPLPLIGDIPVLGSTTVDVAAAATQLFAQGMLRNPRVSVEVENYRPFFIVGEVRVPGQYPYVAGLTAWNAIATAQGLTPRGRKSVVYIRRFGEPAELAYKLTPDLRVWPGDTIRVQERYF